MAYETREPWKKIFKLKKIVIPRLIIRPLQPGDEVGINKAINNSLDSLVEWMPWANDPSLETTKCFVEKAVNDQKGKKLDDFPMVTIVKDNGSIIGVSGYNGRSRFSVGEYDIGYWCDVNYQGKGYVTEYVNALTRYALSNLCGNSVSIWMQVGNIKSESVAKRLNFFNQGEYPSRTVSGAKDYCYSCKKVVSLPSLEVSFYE